MGIPFPLLKTEICPDSRSTVTLISSMFLSFCLLSAAFTRISSKILYKPGTNETSRFSMRPVLLLNAHICFLSRSTEPMYVSGRLMMCSSCVSYRYRLASNRRSSRNNNSSSPSDTFQRSLSLPWKACRILAQSHRPSQSSRLRSLLEVCHLFSSVQAPSSASSL